jgi:hypothetical protein
MNSKKRRIEKKEERKKGKGVNKRNTVELAKFL